MPRVSFQITVRSICSSSVLQCVRPGALQLQHTPSLRHRHSCQYPSPTRLSSSLVQLLIRATLTLHIDHRFNQHAEVLQMGSSFKSAVFADDVAENLRSWAEAARERNRMAAGGDVVGCLGAAARPDAVVQLRNLSLP
jgi:hypothetical protein